MADKKQLNPFLKVAFDIGPLVLFFLANGRFGIFTATGVFMAASLSAIAATYAMTRHLAIMPIVTAVIVLIFGSLTLIWQIAARRGARPDVSSHRRGLAEANAMLVAVFLFSGGVKRNRLAYPVDGFLGELQVVRSPAAHLFVRRITDTADQKIQHRA